MAAVTLLWHWRCEEHQSLRRALNKGCSGSMIVQVAAIGVACMLEQVLVPLANTCCYGRPMQLLLPMPREPPL
jgi:hypothetical protein